MDFTRAKISMFLRNRWVVNAVRTIYFKERYQAGELLH
mgnify:CR=1 FL=1